MDRGRVLAVAAGLTVSIGASSALAATGGPPAGRPAGVDASGRPTPPEPRPVRPKAERRERTFAGQNAAEAMSTAKREFPGFVGEKAWADLGDEAEVEVKRYLGAQAAMVEAGGKPALVQSQLPLAVETPEGLQAIDSDLIDAGDRVKPKRPLTRYTLGDRAGSDQLEFDASGLAVGPSGAADSTGSELEEARGHHSVARDTDLFVKPTPIGAQFGWLLRSIDSPGLLRLKVTMRPGDRLVTTSPDGEGERKGPEGAAIVLRDGKAALSISPTIAIDSDGAPVPVTVTTDADELLIRVDTSQARLPVLVDPYVAEDQRFWLTNLNLDFRGWRQQQSGGSFFIFQGQSGFGNGQYLASNPGQNYAPNAFAQWIFDAPFVPGFEAEGAHIFKADFGQTVHSVSDRGSCIGEGIYNRQQQRYEAQGGYRNASVFDTYTGYPQPGSPTFGFPPYLNCGPEGVPGQGTTYGYKVHCLSICGEDGGNATFGSPGNQAVLTMIQGGGVPGRGGVVYQGSSLIFLSEQARPRMTGNSAPAGWTNQPFTLTSTATDYGLGAYRQSASAPGYSGVTSNGNCDGAQPSEGGPPGSTNTGDRNRRCPQNLGVGVASAALEEGSYDVTFRGVDVVDNETTRAVPVKIDRTEPDFSPAAR